MSYIGAPASHAAAVSASDSVDFTNPARSIYVGTSGNMTVKMYPSGEIVTFSNVPTGILPIQVARINITGLTAGNLVALW